MPVFHHITASMDLLCQPLVGLEAYLCELFSLLEKFLCTVREHLVERSKTYLALKEVLELAPVRLLAVK